MSTTTDTTQAERERLRENASSWWYGGASCPVGPETPVRTPGGGDSWLHSCGSCPTVPDLEQTEEGLRRWTVGQLREHPPAHRDLCPRCWPDALLPEAKIDSDDETDQTRLTNWQCQQRR